MENLKISELVKELDRDLKGKEHKNCLGCESDYIVDTGLDIPYQSFCEICIRDGIADAILGF